MQQQANYHYVPHNHNNANHHYSRPSNDHQDYYNCGTTFQEDTGNNVRCCSTTTPFKRQMSIKNRWKSTLLILKNRKKLNNIDNSCDGRGESVCNNNNNCDRSRNASPLPPPPSVRSHKFVATFDEYACDACGSYINHEDDDYNGVICSKCGIAAHVSCQMSSDLAPCQNNNNNGGSSDHHHNNYNCQQDDDDDKPIVVDPIYLALKRGNEMSSNSKRRQLSPTASNGANGTLLDIRDYFSGDNSTTSGVFLSSRPSSQQASPLILTPPMTCRNSPSPPIMNNAVSKPKLIMPKMVPNTKDETRNEQRFSKNLNTHSTKRRFRAPKLNSKMKSLSLDCSEFSKIHKKLAGINSENSSPIPTRRSVRVPPCQDDEDARLEEFNSPFMDTVPCQSTRCNSISKLPSSQFAVVHDYRPKFAAECELRIGDRVIVMEKKDRDWWQGKNLAGKTGIFPSTCVAHIHSNERIMQLIQNVNLVDGTKNLRLYRDQVVFASIDKPVVNGFVAIRTEFDHKINCPVSYMTNLEMLC